MLHELISNEQDFVAAEKKALAVGAKKFFLEVCGKPVYCTKKRC